MGIDDLLKTDIKNGLNKGETVSIKELFEESMLPRSVINKILNEGYVKSIKNNQLCFNNDYSDLRISNNERLNGVYVLSFAAIKFIDQIILGAEKPSFYKNGHITNEEEGKIDWAFMSFSTDQKTICEYAEKIAVQYGDKNHSYKDFEKFVKK